MKPLLSPKDQAEREAGFKHFPDAPATRKDICESERRIEAMLIATAFCIEELINKTTEKLMALGDDLIAAATTLSTAADALSVKTDTLVTAAEAVIAALKGASGLPPGAADALAAMNKSIAGAKATGDKLDTEVANLDAVLPTPAPPAP